VTDTLHHLKLVPKVAPGYTEKQTGIWRSSFSPCGPAARTGCLRRESDYFWEPAVGCRWLERL